MSIEIKDSAHATVVLTMQKDGWYSAEAFIGDQSIGIGTAMGGWDAALSVANELLWLYDTGADDGYSGWD